MTDPIADMLTRIRNAVHARHQRVDVPASRFKAEIARILEQEGYIQGFKTVEAGEDRSEAAVPPGIRSLLRISLKYGPRGENVITGLDDGCARAGRGQKAAAPPSNVMNSRRRMWPPQAHAGEPGA